MTALKPHPEYVDSGIEWLGNIPAAWEVNKVGRVSRFTVGWTPPTGDSASFDGDNLWANISDIGAKVLADTAKRISDGAVRAARIRLSPAGSLLFSFKLSVGQVSFAGRDMYTNEAIATFSQNGGMALDYAYYAFPVFIVENASENIYGAKILNQSLIRGAPIPVPVLEEQRAIASFLDREAAEIDAFIADQEELIRLLNERRAATITQAVTKGLEPNVPMKDSGVEWLGEVPEHWTVQKLGWLGRIGNGSTPSRDNVQYWMDGSIPWLNSSCVHGRYVESAEQFITPQAVTECHLPEVTPESLLVGLTGQGKTRGSVTQLKFSSTINQHMAYIKFRSGTVSDFGYWALRAAYPTLRFLSDGNGGTKGALTCELLSQFKVPLPSVNEQQRIADHLDHETAEIDAAIADAKEAIELSKERRAALISAAVTGKIDVRDHPVAKGAA